MTQNTLFGKPEEEVETPQETDDYIPEEETKVTDENGWGDYDHQEILSKKEEEGYCYHYLQLFTKSDLNGISYSVHLSDTYAMPKEFMGGGFACGGELDLENPKKYFDKIMEHKLKDQKEPYKKLSQELWKVDSQESSDFYRLVPMKNYIVIIGKKLREMLKEKGFVFEEWYKKYRAIEENPATEEYDKEVTVAKDLLIKGSNLMKKINLIHESIKYKLGRRRTTYGHDSIQDHYGDIGVDDLMQKLREIQQEVIVVNKGLDKHYKRRYHDDYEVFNAKSITEVM